MTLNADKLKPPFFNISVFWFIKYIVFYVFMMFKTGNYAFVKVGELKTGGDWFYYLWLFLFLPVLFTIILSAPIYYSFKTKNAVFILLMAGVLAIEYGFYTWLASPSDYLNGVYNGIISVLVFTLFFYKHLNKTVKGALD